MEEQIKELMGESYHEGITNEEIQSFFNKSLLETGKYVNKDMAESEKKKLQALIAEKDNALKNKMTEEEKKTAEQQNALKEIEELKQQLAQSKVSGNKDKALSLLAETRVNAGIKDDDSEFIGFIDNIVSEDEEKTKNISSYISKLVKEAYEKGKADITKDKMAKMGGSFKVNENNENQSEEENFGSSLAKTTMVNKNKQNVYFQ